MAVDVETLKDAYALAHQQQPAQGEQLPEGFYPAPTTEPSDRGEYGEPAPKPPPPLPEGVDQVKALKDAYSEVHPPNLLEASFGRMFEFAGTAAKEAAQDVARAATGVTAPAAILTNLSQAPNLQGLSVDQVKDVRDQMVTQKADIDSRLSELMKAGVPDEGTIYQFGQISNSLDARIKQADGIIASGQAAFQPSPSTEPLGRYLRAFGERATPATRETLDRIFPTDADFVNSFPGQVATLGADAIYLGGASALGVGLPAAVGLMGGAQYEDAKAHGASDEVAERAALFSDLSTAVSMPVFGGVTTALGKSFAGMTANEGMKALIEAGTHITGTTATMEAFQLEQNAIAKLSGYDPDRRLDEGTWNAIFTGLGWGVIEQAIAQSPRLARLNKPDVAVRNKPGTPPETGPQATAPQPVTPQAPTPPSPLEQAVQSAQQAAAAPTPEASLAAQGDPRQRLAEQATILEQAAAGTAPAAPTAEITPVAEAPRPTETPEELEARAAAARAGIEEEFAKGFTQPQLPAKAPSLAPFFEPAAKPVQARQPDSGTVESAMITQTHRGTYQVQMPPTIDPGLEGLGELHQREFDTPAQAGAAASRMFRRAGYEPIITPETAPRPAEAYSFASGAHQNAFDELVRRGVPRDEAYDRVSRSRSDNYQDILRDASLAASPAWYEREGYPSRVAPEAAAEIPETPVTPDLAKAEVNRAQAGLGMEDHLHYVPNAEALPDHVKNGLTVGERNNTAQIVRDNKLGDVYVIGDRFSGLQELRRAIIEETLPYTYRNLTDLKVVHDPTTGDLGYYDHINDSPTLNTHAILRRADPYTEAKKTAMEEVDVHQGISRVVGTRNAPIYVDAMNSVQRNFDRLGLNDILAQKKGYANLAEMAKAYGVEDYATNRQSQHKLTEELIGAYSRTFGSPEELTRNGPRWYQNALRGLNNAIRSSLGIKLADYDVQSLLADSASALRQAKRNEQGQFHPETDAKAKEDMDRFRMANRMPEAEGAAPGAGEKAEIAPELVRARAAELQEGLSAEEGARLQELKQALGNRNLSLRERMNRLSQETAVYNKVHDQVLMQAALDTYRRDFGNDPSTAISEILQWRKNAPPDANVPALVEVTTRQTRDLINNLKANDQPTQASFYEAKLDRFNREMAPRVTSSAQELSAQRLRYLDGFSAAADFKKDLNERQTSELNKPINSTEKDAADKGLDAVRDVNKDAAASLKSQTKNEIDRIAAAAARRFGTTKSLPEQYTEALVNAIDTALNRVGKPKERAPLEAVYDTFRKQIQQVIREQVTPPERPKGTPPSPTDTLRTVLEHHYPYYAEAWKRTVDKLQGTDPQLYSALDRAYAEPIGRKLADQLALQHGQDLSDLIYHHFSNIDRITENLADRIAATTGIPNQTAMTISDILQDHFRDIVKTEQQAKLQQILDKVGGTSKPAKGELDRLVDHMALGSLDSSEWLNLVAPRFGLQAHTPEIIDQLRQAGDYYQRLRDDALSDSAIAQNVRRQMGQLTRINSDSPVSRFWRYVNDVYGSGLITSPITHAPYFQQAGMVNAWDTLVNGIRTAARTGDPMVLAQMLPKALAGYARGLEEFGPVFRGIKSHEGFLAKEGGKFLYPSPMETTEFSWQNPGTWFSRYKYVRNFLDAISNLMLHGPEYANLYANAFQLAWDKGLRAQDAWDRASAVTLGTSKQKNDALEYAKQKGTEYNLTSDQQRMLYQERLDQLKTTSDLPPGAEADGESKALVDAARAARFSALQGTLRGEVPGFWGGVSRGLISFASKVPAFRSIAPFLKIPFKAISEFQAWSPIGFYRSIPDLVPPSVPGVRLLEQLGGGIRNYLKDIPGMEKKIESGEFTDEMQRQLAWNQMSKAIAGTSLLGGLHILQRMWLGNPNPPIRITYLGPSNYNQQQIERGKGWQPRSVYIDPSVPVLGALSPGWHSYENTPFRMGLAGLGAWEDAARYDKKDPADPGLVYRAGSAFFTSAIGSPLQGLDSVLNAATKMQGADAQREAGNFAASTLSALVTTPFGGTAFRHFYRLYDPTEYEARPGDYFQKFLRNVPVVNSRLLEPKLNVFGEKLESTPLHNIPEYASQVPSETKDPVWNYLATHPDITILMPGNNGTLAGIKMTPEEIYQHHLARGPFFKSELERAFSSPSFTELPADQQNDIMKRVYEPAANRIGDAAVYRYRQEHPPETEPAIRHAPLRHH